MLVHGDLLWRVTKSADYARVPRRCQPLSTYARGMPALTPVHVDAALLVLDKPAGLLAVPGRREADCLSTRAQRQWPDALVVHRLDMATSGLMLLARGAAMQRQLSMAFAAREVDKRYEALVHGTIDGDTGEIALPIGADWPNRPRQRIDAEQGRPATTRWRVLARSDDRRTTRLELEPVTGRTHQLRVHLQAIGHPIVGDALYGPPTHGSERLHLHATELALIHPLDGRRLVLRSTTPF